MERRVGDPSESVRTGSGGWFRRSNLGWWLGLALAAGYLWTRDRSWTPRWRDTLPLLAALPLCGWFGMPWRRRPDLLSPSASVLVCAASCFVAGLALDLLSLLTLAWVLALSAWLRSQLSARDWVERRRLLVLPAMAFPWLTLDFDRLGWWFRLSAARVVDVVFRGLGFDVSQEGTQLVVQGSAVSVDASCAGLGTLQAMLIAGVLAAHLSLGRRPALGWLLLGLAGLAWIANTLRVMLLTAAAMTFGHEFAMGTFHTLGGWFVLVLMFTLALACFRLFATTRPAGPTSS